MPPSTKHIMCLNFALKCWHTNTINHVRDSLSPPIVVSGLYLVTRIELATDKNTMINLELHDLGGKKYV